MTNGERKGPPVQAVEGDPREDLLFYRFIIDSLPVAILTVDSQYRITSFNPWAEEVTGYSRDEALGHYCGDILQGGMCKLDCPLKRAIRRESSFVRLDTTIQNKQGETIPVRMNTAALIDDKGALVGAVEAFQDISFMKAVEREKDNLISMFAHDMKSSLTIIGGFVLRLMKRATDLDDEKRRKYLGIIQEETNKLDFLVDDFLEFARLQTGKLKLNFETTSLDRELMELMETYQAKARQSGIKLEFQDDKILPVVEADPNRLRRAFTNLLDNAFKYSTKGGTITLSTRETPKEIMITIRDNGQGIDPEDLPHIFEIFYRGKGANGKEGSGVGLAIVKAIVEGHGGRVLVESEPGKGAAFTITLPKSRG
ncbi:MAG: PAS domain-containing sensor histidine kinase [Deltaproteobacteria bacterium]|nr:PAS domain-containing sensor histidine kinase [Deltaproteobacteria bacterium]MBW2016957.1 PAS domain-containing sensor histidine kinase [Deltaproteobacteria bacterium]MBW2129561.1 PAS domain-containing sensor histidine kinase [Deltaproteobacteria bacterium]MBW2302432.1 PAS domain-containing sensor histidine kinase [Deltaproteobacteria bacterium]